MRYFLISLLCIGYTAFGQNSGSIDQTFNPADQGQLPSGMVNFDVNKSLRLSNDKLLIAGEFTTIYNTTANRIALIDNNGDLVPSFNSGSGFDNTVLDLFEQTDGKIIVAGDFTMYNDTAANKIVRIFANGNIDTSFHPDPSIADKVYDVDQLSDGKLVICGNFFQGILKLETNGAIDPSFNVNSNSPGSVTCLKATPDDKVIIAGDFNLNGASYSGVTRLTSSGAMDPTFQFFNCGAYAVYRKIEAISNGNYVVCGRFDVASPQINGAYVMDSLGIVQQNTLGLIMSAVDFDIYDVHYLGNDTLMLAGSKNINNYSMGIYIRKISASQGLPAPDFHSELFGEMVSSICNIQTVTQLSNGNFFVGGNFTTFAQATRNYCAQLSSTGKLIPGFNKTTACNSDVKITKVFSDGSIFAGGTVTSYDGSVAYHLFKLNSDGSLANGFNPGTAIFENIVEISETPDHKILVAHNEGNQGHLTLLDLDGTVDALFNPTFSSTISHFAFQNDGRIVVSGQFTWVNGTSHNRIVCLDQYGNTDNSFNSSVNDDIKKIAVQSNGKIILYGNFTSVNGVNKNFLARLEANGDLDMSFNNGMILNGGAIDFQVQADDRIVLMGLQTNVPPVFRLLANGALDPTFNANASFPFTTLRNILVGPDGAIYISTDYQGADQLVKLKPNGSLDSDFEIGNTSFYTIMDFGLQADNKLIVVGRFNEYNSIGKNRILRLNNGFYPSDLVCFTTPSDLNACNGKVMLSISGTPQFTFDIGSGSTIISNGYAIFQSLCPGIYSASATDGNGNVFSTAFVIPSDSTYLFTDSITNGPVLDSLVAVSENCNIDYASIDTVYMDSFTLLSGDTAVVNWAVVTSFDTTYIQAEYVFDQIGNYYLQLQFYCLNKSMGNYFVITKGVNYTGTALFVKPDNPDSFKLDLYPNPNRGEFFIRVEKPVSIQIRNQSGQLILSDESNDLDRSIRLENIESGLYSVLITEKDSGTTHIQKVVILE